MSSTTTTQGASDIRMDYMKLLVTQLQNQNPLEPMTNDQMTAQLTQISQLEQMENVNASFDKVLDLIDKNYAKELLGKEISFTTGSEDEDAEPVTGLVKQISQTENDIELLVGNHTIGLEDILSVRNP